MISRRPTVLLLIPHLGGGGAERVTALLARSLSSQKYDVHLGLVTTSDFACEALPSRVKVHPLGASHVRFAAPALLRLVHALRPDVILSGMAHLNFLVLLLRPFFPRKTRILVRQNSTVSADLCSGKLPRYTRWLYRLLYRHADRIVCQTDAMATDLAIHAGVENSHVMVLPNPVDADAIRIACSNGLHQWSGRGPHLLAVGRLSREKGFDLLVEAFASFRIKFPEADLTILGSGPEETALTAMCRALRLESAVRFAGHVPQPELYFRGATIFVLSSRREGLPNALLEAAAGGLPIAAVPAAQGVVDLLKGKQGVWIAAEISSKALTRCLLAAMQQVHLGRPFAHSWIQPFCLEHAISRYEELIDQILDHEPQCITSHLLYQR